MLRDTPPSSPQLIREGDEDGMVYLGDADEVLSLEDNESESEADDESRDVKDDAVVVFTGHQGSVFSGSLNKDVTLAATGGEDDKAFVWEVSSGRVVLECTGHTDSIVFAIFSHDGTYMASADMTGVIQVWKMSNKSLIWDYTISDITWMVWHSVANILFGSTDSGEIYMWKIPSGECKIFQSHGQRVEQAVLMPDGKRMAVGYDDGKLRLYDLKSGVVLFTIFSDIGHSSTITALDCHTDNNLIISGSMDGKTVLSASQSGKIIGVLQKLKNIESSNAAASTADNEADNANTSEELGNWVEAVAFCKDPEYQVAATGTVNGQIYIWDISKRVPRHVIQQDGGVTKLVWYSNTSTLYSAGLDGMVRCFNARSGQQILLLTGHTADILDLSISRDGKTILTTSDDATARIFKIANPN